MYGLCTYLAAYILLIPHGIFRCVLGLCTYLPYLLREMLITPLYNLGSKFAWDYVQILLVLVYGGPGRIFLCGNHQDLHVLGSSRCITAVANFGLVLSSNACRLLSIFLLYGTVRKTHFRGVIHIDGCWGLKVAHFDHHNAYGNGFPCVCVHISNLRFSGRPKDVLWGFC